SIHVMDIASRKLVDEPITRAQYPRVSWRPDSRSFFYLRQQALAPGMAATEKYRNGRAWLHVVGTPASADVELAGPGFSPRVAVRPEDFVWVLAIPRS